MFPGTRWVNSQLGYCLTYIKKKKKKVVTLKTNVIFPSGKSQSLSQSLDLSQF